MTIGLVRKAKKERFKWTSLNELSGKSVATLSTDANSPFARQFTAAGLSKAQVQTVQAGVQMVLLGRVDFAMFDDISFSRLESKNKAQLQFSESSLMNTKVSIYMNPKCEIDVPKLTILSKK